MTGKLHIYDNPEERWLVELRVSYPDVSLEPDGGWGAATAKEAARAALELVMGEDGFQTWWVVTDRQTGATHQFEQVHLEGDDEDEEG